MHYNSWFYTRLNVSKIDLILAIVINMKIVETNTSFLIVYWGFFGIIIYFVIIVILNFTQIYDNLLVFFFTIVTLTQVVEVLDIWS